MNPTAQLESRAQHSKQFVEILSPDDFIGFVELRLLGQGYPRQRWYERTTEVPEFDWPHVVKRLDRWDVFVGLALRRERGSGGRANCAATWVLVVDYDAKGEIAAVRFEERLRTFPLPPTMLVRSGSPGACHAYWRLKEPVVFDDGEAAIHYQRAVAGLALHFDSDPAVSDVPRIMRLPGSRNHKPAAGGTVVELISYEPERQYNLSEFDEWLAPAPTQRTPPYGGRLPGDSDVDLVAEFASRGWIRQDQGCDMFYVQCPWDEQHTRRSGVDEAMLWCWEGRWCFNCFHAHCAQCRKVAQVYEYFRLMRVADRLRQGGR